MALLQNFPRLHGAKSAIWRAGYGTYFMKLISSVLLLAAAMVLGSCATITKGTDQVISLDTPGHPGAQCTLISDAIGTRQAVTPATLNLPKGGDNIAITCMKGCYRGTGIISSEVETMTAGNVLAGGIIGLGVDAASGAMHKYTAQNQIALTPQPGCTG